LRQYLWAYVQEDQQRGRTLIEVLGPQRVKRIMRYLAEDYWVRYLGWPDLVSWREGDSGPEGVAFIEVKSSNDKLSDDQRSGSKAIISTCSCRSGWQRLIGHSGSTQSQLL